MYFQNFVFIYLTSELYKHKCLQAKIIKNKKDKGKKTITNMIKAQFFWYETSV